MIHTTSSTPVRTQSLRHKREAAVKSTQSASSNDDKVPVMKDVGTWTPSRKQQSSLEHLKSKFAAKSSVMDIDITTNNHASMDVNVLPWQQFSMPIEQHQLSTTPKDYTIMLNELSVTHAVMAASKFEPIDFVKAEQLVQKFQHLHQLVDTIYNRIRIQTDTQRAAATAFKLDQASAMDFIQDICQSSQQTTLLVDEFYFTSQSAHRTETRYLEHLAGTLATAVQQQYQSPQEDLHRILTKILVKLESTASYFDDTVERQHVPTLTSTSTSSTSSSSSTSSIISSSAFTQANSIDTSPSTVYHIPNEDTPTNTLQQKIEGLIDKLAHLLKQKQELLRVLEIQSNTHEELARQRERSASLVLELERSRSKRQLIAKKQENDMIVLRDQLMQETMRRQSLQDRVTSLEHTLKSKEAEISKLKSQPPTIKEEENHTACQIHIEQLQQELQHNKEAAMEEEKNKEKEHLSLQQQLGAVEQRNTQLQQTIKEQHERELAWSSQKKQILDQCQQVMKTEFTDDCEGAVESTIAYLTERQQQEQAQKSVISNSVPEESHLQHQLTRLQQEFDQAKQTFTTRESAFILQSASTEAELERILKEYDRLTRNIVDFNNERKKFEDEIHVLHQDKQLLEKRICDDKVSSIKESSLRKEFRSLMASVKDKHTKAILQELEKQRQLEQELRDIKSEIEMKRWEKVDVAVQTHYFDIK